MIYSQAPHDAAHPNQWFNLGDWCPLQRMVNSALVHTFYFGCCVDITARVAEILNRKGDFDYYGCLAKNARGFYSKILRKEARSFGRYGGNIFWLCG